MRFTLVVADLWRMRYSGSCTTEPSPHEVLGGVVSMYAARRGGEAYSIVVVDMYRLLNLLIRRNKVEAGGLESFLLGKDFAYGRLEIRSLLPLLARRAHHSFRGWEVKVCTERKTEIGWVSFPAKTLPIKTPRTKRSKLRAPRLAGEGDEGASIEKHHMQCEELLDRAKKDEGRRSFRAAPSASVRPSFHAK